MTEIRCIYTEDVRSACIENRWFKCGTNEQYDTFLEYLYRLEEGSVNVTTDTLGLIAKQIKKYSKTDYTVLSIMFVLANSCCKSFFIPE